jgi:hypothetical protein
MFSYLAIALEEKGKYTLEYLRENQSREKSLVSVTSISTNSFT